MQTQVKQSVMAAMETGNQSVARMLLREFQAVDTEQGQSLQMDVLRTYGIML